MKNLIVLLISAFILTGCGGSGAKIFSKLFYKNSTKTFESTNKYVFKSSDFARSPGLWRCAISKSVNTKYCNNTNDKTSRN